MLGGNYMCERIQPDKFYFGHDRHYFAKRPSSQYFYSGEKGVAALRQIGNNVRERALTSSSRRTRSLHSDRWPLLTMTRVKAPYGSRGFVLCFSISSLFLEADEKNDGVQIVGCSSRLPVVPIKFIHCVKPAGEMCLWQRSALKLRVAFKMLTAGS